MIEQTLRGEGQLVHQKARWCCEDVTHWSRDLRDVRLRHIWKPRARFKKGSIKHFLDLLLSEHRNAMLSGEEVEEQRNPKIRHCEHLSESPGRPGQMRANFRVSGYEYLQEPLSFHGRDPLLKARKLLEVEDIVFSLDLVSRQRRRIGF